MSNIIEKYNYVKKEVIDISKVYQKETEVLKFSSHLEKKLENFNPTIMIYGVYNAGKSTLLNAIFGKEEMAKTGDSPETSKITAYKYNGYTIYDTPGINAPIEHQRVTDEHLSKCELIIFVLSNNGSFEDKYIYEKIGEIIKAKKPILIAMNNKSGIAMNSIEAQNEMDKVNQHLSTICDSMSINKAEEKVNLVFVDAKTALEGKTEEDQELIEESKIEQFEVAMNNLLESSGKNEVSNALNHYIVSYINNTLALIDSKIDNPEMKKTQELITYLERLKQSTLSELKNMAIEHTNIITANLLELILAKDQIKINEMIEKTTKDIGEKINQKIQEVQEEFKSKFIKFREEFEQLSIDMPRADINVDTKSTELINIAEKQNNKATLASASTTIAMMIPPTVIIPTPLGPIPVKPLLAIAGILFGTFANSKEAKINAEAQLDEKRSQHLSAKCKSDEYGIALKNSIHKNINGNINNLFTDIIQKYIEFSTKLENKNNELLENKSKLHNILNRL